MRRHQPARLVVAEQARAGAPRQRSAVNRDAVTRRDVQRGRGDRLGDPVAWLFLVAHASRLSCPGLSRASRLATHSVAFLSEMAGTSPAMTEDLWHRRLSCKPRWTKPARPRRAARSRSAA